MHQFRNVPLVSHHLHISTAASIGGNLHNEYNIESDTKVGIYKAVEIHNQKLSHVGNYVAYKKEDRKVRKIYPNKTVHNKINNSYIIRSDLDI